MELDIDNTLDLNNITINVFNCLNNSLIYEISNITCDDAINASFSNVVKQKPKVYFSKNVIYGVCFVIIVVNLIVVISSGLIIRRNRNSTNAFILLGNVSLADVIMGVTITIGVSVPKTSSLLTCLFQMGGAITSTIASLYSVGLIAIDRYVYIMHGMYYQRWMNRTRVRLMISAIWILSLILGFMPGLDWPNELAREEPCWYGRFIRLAPPSVLCISALISLIPLITACILYIIILMKAIKTVNKIQESLEVTTLEEHNETKLRVFRGRYQRRDTANSNISATTSETREQNIPTGSAVNMVYNDKSDLHKSWYKFKQSVRSKIHKAATKDKTSMRSDLSKWKAVKIVLLTTVSMVVTWVPCIVGTLMYVACDENNSPDFCMKLEAAIVNPLAILGLFNSILNPIIYAWLHKNVKHSIKTIILKIFNIRKTTLSINHSTKFTSNSGIANGSHL